MSYHYNNMRNALRNLILIVGLLALSGCGKRVCVTETIFSVGGCNKDGRCGVLTESGARTAHLPVPGTKYEFCHYE